MLDLSFASSPLALMGAKASIKLRFDTLDHTCFLSLLASNLAEIKSLATTEEDLDALAGKLTSAIQGAY
ncbi:hypothetical protein TSTA_049920 [Talaromyces stipitatus ATCC 10500]|uniref:Uncharacterized protein n=1 Tax=Talaromyces stipitatus (strain ATCC 10500 / CBS 375.48 / QM 6759 / NRRL 1006) TaxID=441959 RepID=B8MLM1_TALSN|nr:uncharacterized protein TSTA_049920 [Talaromyces stipitatus ATCC 10500]EED15554.1 hypothetical protein TSTA_049920 [Talaromyces stipitatus ATCC 10500]